MVCYVITILLFEEYFHVKYLVMVTFCLKKVHITTNKESCFQEPSHTSILVCLRGTPDPGPSSSAKEASVIVLHMAAVIHIIKSHRATMFVEYNQMVLMPYLNNLITDRTTRVGAVDCSRRS